MMFSVIIVRWVLVSLGALFLGQLFFITYPNDIFAWKYFDLRWWYRSALVKDAEK